MAFVGTIIWFLLTMDTIEVSANRLWQWRNGVSPTGSLLAIKISMGHARWRNHNCPLPELSHPAFIGSYQMLLSAQYPLSKIALTVRVLRRRLSWQRKN